MMPEDERAGNIAPELSESDISQMSPLVLAYIGDAIYELLVRERIVSEGNRQVNKLHHESIRYVSAAAQAALMHSMEDRLTPAEMSVYKRGRNATSHTVPKNQSVGDYRVATGFEALMGWLYLNGNLERIAELTGEDMRGLSKKRPSGEKNPEDI